MDKKKKKGVTWVVQATTSLQNPGCTEKRILVQDQDGGNAQHGKERTQHHKHLQKGLSERRGPRAMLHTRKACHTDRRASTSKEPNTHTPNSPGQTYGCSSELTVNQTLANSDPHHSDDNRRYPWP
jgi:hypothetical protein